MKQETIKNIKRYVVSSILTLVIAAVIFGLCALACGKQFGVYMKLVFIPFFVFFAGFFNVFFLKKCKYAPLIPLALSIPAYLIFAEFSWAVFGYFILYAVNWAVGVAIAVLIHSYKKSVRK